MATPYLEIQAQGVSWSVVDCDFSPDQKSIIYSSWSPFVHLCTFNENGQVKQTQIDLKPQSSQFCPFAIRYSPDSKLIFAGTSDYCIYICDIETKKRLVKVCNLNII